MDDLEIEDIVSDTLQNTKYRYYIQVCEKQYGKHIEIPCEGDGTLLLSTLISQFPSACGLKYRHPESHWEIKDIRLLDGRMYSPEEGWDEFTYFISNNFPTADSEIEAVELTTDGYWCQLCKLSGTHTPMSVQAHMQSEKHLRRVKGQELLQKLNESTDCLDHNEATGWFKCKVCSIEMSPQRLDTHLNSTKHKIKLEIQAKGQEILQKLKESTDCFDHDKAMVWFKCNVCKIKVGTPQLLEIHLNSNKHKIKLVKGQELLQKLKESTDCFEHNEAAGYFKCKVCSVEAFTPQLLEVHLNSNKHKIRLEGRPIKRKHDGDPNHIPAKRVAPNPGSSTSTSYISEESSNKNMCIDGNYIEQFQDNSLGKEPEPSSDLKLTVVNPKYSIHPETNLSLCQRYGEVTMANAQMSMDELDSIYGGLCRDFIRGLNIFIGIGGDSHGRRIFFALQGIFLYAFSHFRLFPQSFAILGGRADEYPGKQEFGELKRNTECRIAVICIGGNDIDSWVRPFKSPKMIADDVLNLFLELTCSGKVVFIVALPKRYTQCNVAAEEYERIRSSVCTRLRRQLKSRYLLLPAELLDQGAYRIEQYKNQTPMQVHLKAENYTKLAFVIFFKIIQDLQTERSKPSTLNLILNHLDRE